MLRYCVIGNGIEGKYGANIYMGFLLDNQQMPVMIWNGPSLCKTSGSNVRVDDIARYMWAFECTNTMWFYSLLKAMPMDANLTYDAVNAEYRKHRGEDMVISED